MNCPANTQKGRGTVEQKGQDLVIKNVHSDEGGQYVCNVTNQHGSSYKQFDVTVTRE